MDDSREGGWKTIRSIKFGAAVTAETQRLLDEDSTVVKLRRAGVPRDAMASLVALLVGPLSPSRAAEAAVSWWEGMRAERPLLALLGPTGLGKTTAAARSAYMFVRAWPWNSGAGGGSQREPLVWLNAEDLAVLQSWMNDGKRQYDDALHARLLVIDDAGKESTRPAIAAMTDLLMRRMDAHRDTVISSNLAGKPFAIRYSGASQNKDGGWYMGPVVDRMKAKAYVPELGSYESMRVRAREPGEDA